MSYLFNMKIAKQGFLQCKMTIYMKIVFEYSFFHLFQKFI